MQEKNSSRAHILSRDPQVFESSKRFPPIRFVWRQPKTGNRAEIDLIAIKICQKNLSPLRRLSHKAGISGRLPRSKQKWRAVDVLGDGAVRDADRGGLE
jgi:hypothetical protein